MPDTLHGKPVDWTPQPDWRQRLLRITDRLKQRQPEIRAFLVTGDYAHGAPAPDSVLTCIAFFPDWRPDYPLGPVQALDGLPVALDWPTTATLVEVEPLLQDDLRAHRLATAQSLVSYDSTLDGVLRDFRDRYFSPSERRARIRRLCDHADALLTPDGPGSASPNPGAQQSPAGHPSAPFDAFTFGFGPALCHLVDEPPARRRLLQRFRDAARVRRLSPLADHVTQALGLHDRDLAALLRLAEALRDLAEAHIRATHADAVGGLLPVWASALDKGRRSVDVLSAEDDLPAAAFAACVSGLLIDQAAARVSRRFRAEPAYRALAARLYGAPDLPALRHGVHEIRATQE